MTNHLISAGTLVLALAPITTAALAGTTTVDFENGWDDWQGTGPSGLYQGARIIEDGAPTGDAVNVQAYNFGIEVWTNRNAAFLGNYNDYNEVTLSVDAKADFLDAFGTSPATRSLVVEFRNYRYAHDIFQYGSVFFLLEAEFSAANSSDWTTYSVTFDPNAEALPVGWTGYGGSDDADGPVLPDRATFADVLSNVDEVVIGTLVPVERYPFTYSSVWFDNISITTSVPAPASLGLLATGGLLVSRRRRA